MESLNGKYIEGQALEAELSKVYSDASFLKLIEVINQHKSVAEGDLSVYKAYEFDMEIEPGFILSGKQLGFLNQDKTIQIVYSDTTINTEFPENEKWMVKMIKMDQNGNTKSLISFHFNTAGEVELEVLSADYSEEEILVISEDLPNDPSYVPAPSSSDSIEAQVWWTANGCLPGGYQHCGGNCGYGLDHGGGTPLNYTDRCCIIHDDCYASGARKCKCDTVLLNCIRNEGTVASVGIRAFFAPKAC